MKDEPQINAAIHPETRIGHVHLTVSNLERAVKVYRDVLGFEVTQYYGDSAAFLSAGGYHHHLGLGAPSDGATPPSGALNAPLCWLRCSLTTCRELVGCKSRRGEISRSPL